MPKIINSVRVVIYAIFLPNQSEKEPKNKTPIMFPTKKAICTFLPKYFRSQTKSNLFVAVSYNEYNTNVFHEKYDITSILFNAP